jgi:hypothetical protein
MLSFGSFRFMDVIVRKFVLVYGCYRSEVCLGLWMLSFGIFFRSMHVIVRMFGFMDVIFRKFFRFMDAVVRKFV